MSINPSSSATEWETEELVNPRLDVRSLQQSRAVANRFQILNTDQMNDETQEDDIELIASPVAHKVKKGTLAKKRFPPINQIVIDDNDNLSDSDSEISETETVVDERTSLFRLGLEQSLDRGKIGAINMIDDVKIMEIPSECLIAVLLSFMMTDTIRPNKIGKVAALFTKILDEANSDKHDSMKARKVYTLFTVLFGRRKNKQITLESIISKINNNIWDFKIGDFIRKGP